jgi:hypothetical protein
MISQPEQNSTSELLHTKSISLVTLTTIHTLSFFRANIHNDTSSKYGQIQVIVSSKASKKISGQTVLLRHANIS